MELEQKYNNNNNLYFVKNIHGSTRFTTRRKTNYRYKIKNYTLKKYKYIQT